VTWAGTARNPVSILAPTLAVTSVFH